jgi:hypothetical protein
MASATFLTATARQTRGKFYASEIYQIKGCTGATPIQVLASALSATGLPGTADSLVVTIGAVTKSLGVSVRIPKAEDIDAAEVEVQYTEDELIIAGFGPTIKEFATDLEQIDTFYDYTNRVANLSGTGTPISVSYTGSAATGSQQVSVPALIPRGTRVYTRDETTDPATFADNYIGRTNSATFGVSAAVGTLLCVSIRGVNVGDGRWKNTYAFAKREEGWKAQGRYVLDNGQFPGDATTTNGIVVVTVQGAANFNNLGLL